MKVVSVNTGIATQLSFDGDRVKTGIFKSSAQGPVYLTRTGFRGDVQVDRQNHGGVDKAVCVYCADHFDTWKRETRGAVEPGLFGENLTVTELLEDVVRIGDVYRIGETEVQVSQPRQPCHKLSKKVGDPEFANKVIALGLTGWYFRVLGEGWITQGDAIEVVKRDESSCTIAFANDVMYKRRTNSEDLNRLLAEAGLSEPWRKTLSARL